jgi:hypothetical protein
MGHPQAFPVSTGAEGLVASLMVAKALGKLYGDDTTIPGFDVQFVWLPSATGPLQSSVEDAWWNTLNTNIKDSIVGIVSLDGLSTSTTIAVAGNAAAVSTGLSDNILEALKQATIAVGTHHSFASGALVPGSVWCRATFLCVPCSNPFPCLQAGIFWRHPICTCYKC